MAEATGGTVEWEQAKENFQPLKKGRDAEALVRKLGPGRDDGEDCKRAFWQEIEGYNGTDPLEVWIRFIKWSQGAANSESRRTELLPLLERCTRQLQADERYRGDVRYLRVWIQYADCLPDPRDVFAFLKENEIGQEHALFYEAEATYLELRGSYAKATAAFEAGIQRRAHPVQRLRAKFQEFQERMVRRKEREEQAGGVGLQADVSPLAPARTALRAVPGRLSRGVRASQRPAGPAAAGGLGAGRLMGTRTASGGGNASALDVFVDDEFGGSGENAAPSTTAGRFAPSAWSSLDSFEATRKENERVPSRWAGVRLPQRRGAAAGPVPEPMEIPVDDELAAVPTPMKGRAAPQVTLRQRLERSTTPATVIEALQRDPLRLHAGASETFIAAHLPSASDAGKRKRADAAASAPPPLPPCDGASNQAERSFEEARWRDHQRQCAAAPAAASAARLSQQGHTRAAEGGALVHVQPHGTAAGVPAAAPPRTDCTGGPGAVDGTAQLDTITEVTDEVFDTPTLAVQRGNPAVLAFTPASVLSTAPPRAAAVAVCPQQAAAPAEISNRGDSAGAPATTVPQTLNDNSGSTPTAHKLDPQRSDQLTAPTVVVAAATPAPLAPEESMPPVTASAVGRPTAPSGVPERALAEAQDVTLCTAAAFAELNDMFNSALQHAAPASPAGRAAAPPSPPALKTSAHAANPAPGDEENACPGGGPGGRARLAPRDSPPRRLHSVRSAPVALQRLAADRKPVVALDDAAGVCDTALTVTNPACCLADEEAAPTDVADVPRVSHQAADAELIHAFQPSGSPQQEAFGGGNGSGDYLEPTVTLATREAFAALNGMFAAQLPHERAAGRAAARPAVPLAPRHSARRSLLGGGAAPDTPRGRGVLWAAAGAAAAAREDTRTLPIYEDTQFLRAPANSPADRLAAGSVRPVEDTPLFLDAALALDRTATLAIYEDTQLLAEGPEPASRGGMAASAMQPAPQSPVDGAADATAPLQLYEDTQFLTRALPRRSDGHAVTPFAAGTSPVCTPATEIQQDHQHDDKENGGMEEKENGGFAGGQNSLLGADDRPPLSPLEGAGAAARGIHVDSLNEVPLSNGDGPSDVSELLLDLGGEGELVVSEAGSAV